MNQKCVVALVVVTTGLAGCAAHNERTMIGSLSQELVCGIDESVIDEKERLLPNGWISMPYSPEYWQSYWNHTAYYLGRAEMTTYPGYAGPSGRTLVLYALQQRRENGLPDLVPEERNKDFVSSAYREIESRNETSCQILAMPSPVCYLSPAQRPAAVRFQRECRIGS